MSDRPSPGFEEVSRPQADATVSSAPPEPFANPLLDNEDPDRAAYDRKSVDVMTGEERTKKRVDEIVKGFTDSPYAGDKVTGELLQDMIMYKGTSRRDIAGIMRHNEFPMEIVPYILQKPEVLELMDVMLDDLPSYRTPLGLMLSQVPFSELPQNLQEKIHPSAEVMDTNLKTEHDGWTLCGKTEGYLDWAMQDDSVTLVDDVLLAKARGRITALCMETRKTADDHVLLEGVFYSPVDEASRTKIREDMSNGITKTKTEGGSWVVMRGLLNDERNFIRGERTLENAKKYVKNLPEKASETVKFMGGFEISRSELVRISSSNPYDWGEDGESQVKQKERDLRDQLYASQKT